MSEIQQDCVHCAGSGQIAEKKISLVNGMLLPTETGNMLTCVHCQGRGFQVKNNEDAVCPHCRTKQAVLEPGMDGHEQTLQCAECSESFIVKTNCVFWFTTRIPQ